MPWHKMTISLLDWTAMLRQPQARWTNQTLPKPWWRQKAFPRKEAPCEQGKTQEGLFELQVTSSYIFAPGIAWNCNIKVDLPTFDSTKASSSRCSSCRRSSSRQHGVAAAPGEFLLIEEVKDESFRILFEQSWNVPKHLICAPSLNHCWLIRFKLEDSDQRQGTQHQ